MKTVYSKTAFLNDAITAACESTEPKTKERNKALAAVRWVLKVQGAESYVALTGNAGQTLTTKKAEAVVYDGRDNDDMKLRFAQVKLGVPLEIAPY